MRKVFKNQKDFNGYAEKCYDEIKEVLKKYGLDIAGEDNYDYMTTVILFNKKFKCYVGRTKGFSDFYDK